MCDERSSLSACARVRESDCIHFFYFFANVRVAWCIPISSIRNKIMQIFYSNSLQILNIFQLWILRLGQTVFVFAIFSVIAS